MSKYSRIHTVRTTGDAFLKKKGEKSVTIGGKTFEWIVYEVGPPPLVARRIERKDDYTISFQLDQDT